MKKKNRLFELGLSLFLFLFISSSVFAKSFDKVFEWTKRVQDGEELELKVQVGTDSFTFLRSQATDIDQTIFDRLLEKKEPQASIQLKPLSEGDLLIKYEINKLLRLEQSLTDLKPIAWRKIEFVQIASYPLEDWSDFIKQAILQGLMEYEVNEFNGESFAKLTFKQSGPSNLQFGKKTLKLSDEFYDYMKLSKEFKPCIGNTGKFVVLVHEPHWSLAGQYQLIHGLKSFIDANSQYEFRFLVEGYWEEEIKYILTEPSLLQFSNDATKTAQCFSLLRNFLIDGPLAYRLLYAPNLLAIAIDDPELIKNTHRQPDLKDRFETQKIFIKISEDLGNLKELDNETVQILYQIVNFAYLYSQADIQDLKGQDAVDYFQQVAELYGTLNESLKLLQLEEFSENIEFFEYQSKAYRTEAEIYKCALARDIVMATNTIKHFGSKYAERIPLVFIGNFHTPAIISHLRSNGIGYVVIEPRISLIATEKDQKKFNDALNFDTRPSYLNRLSGALKIQVAPLAKELPDYRFFLERESQKIITRRDDFIASSPLATNNTSRLISAIELNGVFSNAKLEFANQPPKLPFQDAFASFSYDTEEEPPKMLFYNPQDEGWNRSDRLSYFQKVLPILPYKKFREGTKKHSFYQNKDTNRLFLCIYDSQTQMFYFFEGENALNLLKLLVPKDGYMRISIRDIIHGEMEVDHG